MAYKAIVDFKDLQTGHDYNAGDVYPFEGNADEKRVEVLITPTSQRGALIEEVKVVVEKKKPVTSEDKAEKPTRKSKEKK